MSMKRAVSSLLVMIIIASASVLGGGCGSQSRQTKNAENTSGSETSQTAATSANRANTADNLPEGLNFNGATVTIHTRGDTESASEAYIEEMTGDSVDDAVYLRNKAVEERLNVKLKLYAADKWNTYSNSVSALRKSIMAGDGQFDIVAGWSATIPALSLEGLLTNLYGVKYLDTDMPWWVESAVSGLTVSGKLYFVTGDISVRTLLGAMYIFLFNKDVAQNYRTDDLYSVVSGGKWTIDYVYKLTSDIYSDLNGNGSVDAEDLFGISIGTINDADGFMQGSLISMCSRDDKGLPVLSVDTDRLTGLTEKAYRLIWDNPGALTANTDDHPTSRKLMEDNRTLLTIVALDELTKNLRDMKSDYGILPYPKYDENQEKYGTRVQDALALWCIPTDVRDASMSGAVMEALSAESYRNVTEIYFDTACKYKYTRDEESGHMLDLIRESIVMNFESIYNESIGSPWHVLRNLMKAKSSYFSSWWSQNQSVIESKLQTAIQVISGLN